jgi:hypothetical protein
MKMHINRRNFLFSSIGSTVAVIAPFNVTADDSDEQQKTKKHIKCGKINSTDLRYFYYKRNNKANS